MKLTDLKAAVPTHERRIVDVDLSELMQPPAEPNTHVVKLIEPEVKDVYIALNDIAKIKKRRPLEPFDQHFNLSLLLRTHHEPKAENGEELLDFYGHIAEHNPPMWFLIVRTLHIEFPWIQSIFQAADEKKD